MSAPPPPPPPPTLTLRGPPTQPNTANWKNYTSGPKGSIGSLNSHNITLRKRRKNSNLEEAKRKENARRLTKRLTQGLYNPWNSTKLLTSSKFVPNSEKNYEGNGDRQTRKEEKMKETSDYNRIDRLIALFKAALRGSNDKKDSSKKYSSIDIAQYTYVLTANPTTVENKKEFVKIMESLEAFPKETEYNNRIAMLTPEFIKQHGLEHIGMKIDRGKTEKEESKINIQHYIEYTEDELTTIITKYKQTIFDDVLGLFIILTIFILYSIAYKFPVNMIDNIKEFINKKNVEEHIDFLKRREVNTEIIKREKHTTRRWYKNLEMVTPLGAVPVIVVCTPLIVLGVLFPPLGVLAIIGAVGAGIIAIVPPYKLIKNLLKIKKGNEIDNSLNKSLEKSIINIKLIITILFKLITYKGNEKFVISTEIPFIQHDYDFLKEFDMMFSDWYTDTELYNFVLLFTRERLKESLKEKYNEKRELPPGWHEFKADDGSVYYNSNEFSKKEESPLNRYKLISWVMPMAAFGVNDAYNSNITIYQPSVSKK